MFTGKIVPPFKYRIFGFFMPDAGISMPNFDVDSKTFTFSDGEKATARWAVMKRYGSKDQNRLYKVWEDKTFPTYSIAMGTRENKIVVRIYTYHRRLHEHFKSKLDL
jgi:hypothetical protein